MLFSFSQDKTSFHNSEDTLQRESKCSMDSGSSLQKVQLGDWEKPKWNNLSLVKTMLLRILYWNSLSLESSVVRKGREETFSQLIDVSEYLSMNFCWAVGRVCFLRKKESYICLEVTSEIRTQPQFSLIYGVQGMGFISFVQTGDLIIVFQSDGRVNYSHIKETLFRRNQHIGVFV